MKQLLLLLFTFYTVNANAMSPVDVVQSFGDNLSNWCKTKDARYCDAMLEFTRGGISCRVSDRIITDNLSEDFDNDLYNMQSFVVLFQKYIHSGVSVVFDNISLVDGNKKSDDAKPLLVSCDIQIRGAFNINTKDVFYIRDNKITAITDYNYITLLKEALDFFGRGEYTESFNRYWYLANYCKDDSIADTAGGYAFYMLKNDKGCKHIDKYVRNVWMANKIWSNAQLIGMDELINDWIVYKHPAALLCPSPNEISYWWDLKLYSRKIKKDAHNSKLFVKQHHLGGDNPLYLYVKKLESQFVPDLYTGRDYIFYKDNDYLFSILPYTSIPKKHFSFIRKYYEEIGRHKIHLYAHSPTVKKFGTLWGYVNEKGKEISSNRYLFAFPFDKTQRLALVKDKNEKWGYINEQGEYVIKPVYDMGQELFSKGKTFVIKNKQLVQINSSGEELCFFSGYADMVISPNSKVFVAYNVNQKSFDVFNYDGTIIFRYGYDEHLILRDLKTWRELHKEYDKDKQKWKYVDENGVELNAPPFAIIIFGGIHSVDWISCSMKN